MRDDDDDDDDDVGVHRPTAAEESSCCVRFGRAMHVCFWLLDWALVRESGCKSCNIWLFELRFYVPRETKSHFRDVKCAFSVRQELFGEPRKTDAGGWFYVVEVSFGALILLIGWHKVHWREQHPAGKNPPTGFCFHGDIQKRWLAAGKLTIFVFVYVLSYFDAQTVLEHRKQQSISGVGDWLGVSEMW